MPHRIPPGTSPPSPLIAEVRYPLPQLLEELSIERATGSFAMEKLDQTEIAKLFKARTPSHRGKSRK